MEQAKDGKDEVFTFVGSSLTGQRHRLVLVNISNVTFEQYAPTKGRDNIIGIPTGSFLGSRICLALLTKKAV